MKPDSKTPKFARHRQPSEMRAMLAKRGWSMNTTSYDSGGDRVIIYFHHGDTKGEIYYNTFNGQFFGRYFVLPTAKSFNEKSTDLDSEPWYQEILKLLFVPQKKPSKTAA